MHFFAAIERTQQDTTQTVNTRCLFTSLDVVYPLRYRDNLVTAKVAASIGSTQYLTVRYGYNDNIFPFGAGPVASPDSWGDATNSFNSININHNWVLGASRINELVFQYADFADRLGARGHALENPEIDPAEPVQVVNPMTGPERVWSHSEQRLRKRLRPSSHCDANRAAPG